MAPIIEKSKYGLKLDVCKWGYPLSQGKNLVINARTESAVDKTSFRNGILYHRILIPASGFYEWNRLKEKNVFSRYDAPVLYMAGFCDWFENERRFVIMTTAANESMIKVHDRMPLILEKEQLEDWFDDRKMEQILHQVPVVPMYPMSKDEVNYERLIKILSLYRLTLGQARQEELLEYLFKEFKDTSGLKKLFIDLSPFSKGKEGIYIKENR